MAKISAELNPDSPLPKLRGDVELSEGAAEIDGSPSWVLHDNVRHKFYKIGWIEFKILAYWGEGTAAQIVQKIESETTLRIEPEDVLRFTKFLAFHFLVVQSELGVSRKFASYLERQKEGFWELLLKQYLFFRIPLVHPHRFLSSVLPFLKFIYTKYFFYFNLFLFFVSLYLLGRKFDEFINTFIYSFTFDGLLVYFFALFFAKVIHEFGHGLTATYYGVKVPSMGVAFLVMWPVLYTDTTQIWKVPNRNARLSVGAAGMVAELLLAIYASLLWHFTSPGPLQSACFALATVTWIITLTINLSPFMRFDGYYLLSDFLGVENLQERSFALAKWQMREFIFKYGEDQPEFFSKKMFRTLIAFAYFTWIYRFFLFMGIAFLVYYFFFKVLGIVLMLVEISWFIMLPIAKELGVWYKMRKKAKWSWGGITSLLIVFGIVGLVFMPYRSSIYAPTFVYKPSSFKLYPSMPSQLVDIKVKLGDSVQQGNVLAVLSDAGLLFQQQKAKTRIEFTKYQLEHQVFDSLNAQNIKLIQQGYEKAVAELQSTEEQLKNIIIKAPFDGSIAELDPMLRPGIWVNTKGLLGILNKKEQPVFEAFVFEEDLKALTKTKKGIFYPDDILQKPISVSLWEFEKTNVLSLNRPELASLFKGEIAVEKDEKGKLIPQKALYRCVFRSDIELPDLLQTIRGAIKIDSDAYSLASRLWHHVGAILIRESGF